MRNIIEFSQNLSSSYIPSKKGEFLKSKKRNTQIKDGIKRNTIQNFSYPHPKKKKKIE